MWRYDQRSGELWEGDQYVTRGYSGFGDYKNIPEYEVVRHLGPIPRGQYVIGPLRDSLRTGKNVLDLTPLSSTETYGRGDFEIHGDKKAAPGAASHGCIILPLAVRLRIGATLGTLEVFTS